MPPTCVSYLVLNSEPFDISSEPSSVEPVAETVKFRLPATLSIGTPETRPILTFNFKTKSPTGQFGVWINTPNSAFVTQMQSVRPSWSSHPGTVLSAWKSVPGALVQLGGDNFVRFGFAAGQQARVTVLDVVLWFHVSC